MLGRKRTWVSRQGNIYKATNQQHEKIIQKSTDAHDLDKDFTLVLFDMAGAMRHFEVLKKKKKGLVRNKKYYTYLIMLSAMTTFPEPGIKGTACTISVS